MIMQKITITFLSMCQLVFGFRALSGFLRRSQTVQSVSGFDPKDFEQAIKSRSPMPQSATPIDPLAYEELRKGQEVNVVNALGSDREKLFKTYPIEHYILPVLPDCNNYYSGEFKDIFWHQNHDQVYVYIPVADDVTRSDIKVKFEALSVSVVVRGEEVAAFPCKERLIPDGSFWTLERDDKDMRYIHLDIEKRFRMINWRGIFGEHATPNAAEISERKTQILQQMYEANKGMAKLSGLEPESMRDMMLNNDINRMISSDLDDAPVATIHDADGYPVRSGSPEELGIDFDPKRYESIDWSKQKIDSINGVQVVEVPRTEGSEFEDEDEVLEGELL